MPKQIFARKKKYLQGKKKNLLGIKYLIGHEIFARKTKFCLEKLNFQGKIKCCLGKYQHLLGMFLFLCKFFFLPKAVLVADFFYIYITVKRVHNGLCTQRKPVNNEHL
jgi:hypothetical protein